MLDFAPGITAGIGTVISALTFSFILFQSISVERSRLSIPLVLIEDDEISVAIANTGKRPALLKSIGLICNVIGVEADFYPEGASPVRSIVLKPEEVTQVSIDTKKSVFAGSSGPEDDVEILSTILLKELNTVSRRTCDVVALAVDSDGETHQLFNYPDRLSIMIALQRLFARQDKHPEFQIQSLSGSLIGQYYTGERLMSPTVLSAYLAAKKTKP